MIARTRRLAPLKANTVLHRRKATLLRATLHRVSTGLHLSKAILLKVNKATRHKANRATLRKVNNMANSSDLHKDILLSKVDTAPLLLLGTSEFV
jgi:hypothetical protein